MQKRRPDKEDTQEIKLPKSRDDYGDNFNSPCSNVEDKTKNCFKITKTDKKKLIILISSIITIFVIIIIIITVAVGISNSSLEQNFQSTTTTLTNITQKTPTNVPNTTTISNYSKETQMYNTIAEESTSKETKEPTTAIPTTEPITTVQEETNITEEPSITTEPTETEEETSVEKSISVSDILVFKTDDGIFVPKISGSFIGYSPEELLNEVTVTTSSGTPTLSYPHIENSNSFTFNLNLEDCTGELHIHIDTYDFYQSIDSFPD